MLQFVVVEIYNDAWPSFNIPFSSTKYLKSKQQSKKHMNK